MKQLGDGCRDKPARDDATNSRILKAESKLDAAIVKACTGIDPTNLGFPGGCPDGTGPPFSLDDLRACIRTGYEQQALEAVNLAFPPP